MDLWSQLRLGVGFLCIEEVNRAVESGDLGPVSRWTPSFFRWELSHDTDRGKKYFSHDLGCHHQAELSDPLKNLE